MEYIFVGIWVLCGVISYGLSFAWYQRNWPLSAKERYWRDMADCALLSLFGPISLATFLVHTLWFPQKLQGFKWK